MRILPQSVVDILDQVKDIDGELFWIDKAVPTNHDFYLWRGWRNGETRRRASAYILTREVAEYLMRSRSGPHGPDLPVTEAVLRRFRGRLGIPTARDIAYREWQRWSLKTPKPIKDVFGREYLVYKEVPCKLGIKLPWGIPSAKDVGRSKVQRPRYILSPLLAEALRNWNGRQLHLAENLPFDRKTLDRMRHALGLDWYDDVVCWWADRFDELMHMPSSSFAAKHGKQLRTVRDQRYAINHVRSRLNDPAFVQLLAADWSDKTQNVKRRMGAQYRRLQIYRRAWRILRAAGQLDRKDAA